jgi:predicted TIM-barrel fold metal-dependent hydrolase
MNRRELIKLASTSAILASGGYPAEASRSASDGLQLEQYQPKSMLHAEETKVLTSRYPVIDFHTHITQQQRKDGALILKQNATADECLAVMNRKNIRMMVDLTGGYGENLNTAISRLQTPHPDRFLVFVEPAWDRVAEFGYPAYQAHEIERAHAAGARGIKVLKTLGLYVREQVTQGKLLRVDDPRFDPMWETAASLRMPVAIHTSDPEAFFLPTDRFNERWEELHAHPDWSFHGKDFPTNLELQEARRNIMRRHPRTQFVCLHVADSENLPYVSQCLDSHPNMTVEIAARIGELGRQPRAAKTFIDKYQDRVLFGTDAVPQGYDTPQQVFGDSLYEIYYRFLETEDEYFDYAPAATPPQGRWRIYGLGLSDTVLRKIYYQNATRLLNL